MNCNTAFQFFCALAVSCFLFSATSVAQKEYTIDVKITGIDAYPMLGNALILNPTDSSLIRGFHYMDGVLKIENVREQNCLLKLTSSDYADSIITINNTELKNLDLGEIQMKSSLQDMEGVTISASIPIFEKNSEGALVVNVKSTMLGSSSSVLEILSKSPNVTISGSVVSVIPKGEALLYKNGKRISFEQLGSISAQSVDKIEIISNPSAKYDSEGRAVINIRTVVNTSEGFEVGIVQNFVFAKHFLYAPSLSFNYRKGKFSVNANYSVTVGKDWNKGLFDRSLPFSSGVYRSNSQSEENTRLTYVGNHSLGLGYQINAKHDISVEYSGLYNVFDLDVQGNNRITAPNADITALTISNNGSTINNNNSISVNYNGVLDTLGSSIFIGGQYSQFSNALNDLIDESITFNGNLISESQRNNIGSNDISLLTARVDYSKIFRNEMRLEIGGKYGEVKNSSVIDLYSRPPGGTFSLIPGYSNNFEYLEKIPAFFSQLNGKMSKKVKYSVGARMEYSMITGISKALNKTVIDTTYLNLFPNATLNYIASEKWSYSLTYSGRIGRPNYQDLDPFLWYQDSLTSVQGNPFLLPELTKNGEFSVNYKAHSFTVGYAHSKNPSRAILTPGTTGDGSSIYQRANFQQKHSLYSSLNIPLEKKFWKSFNTISLTLNKYEDNRPEFAVGTPIPQLYIYSYHRFRVKKWFNLELIFNYEGVKNDGFYRDNARYTVTGAIAKQFLNGDLSVRILANDFLRSYRQIGSSSVNGVIVNFDQRLNTNFYRLTVVYYFGKLRNVNYKNKATGTEEFDRVKK